MNLICKVAGLSTSSLSVESLIRRFLHETFDSKFLYVISPWVTLFEFERPFIHLPFVEARRVDEVFRAFVFAGIDVRVLMRCVDDSIDVGLLRLLRLLRNNRDVCRTSQQYIAGEILKYIADRISELIKTVKIVNTLRDILGENLRFDIPASGWHRRLHTKLYLNDRSAIVGSANFTRSGILSDGNWECLLHFTRDAKKLYEDALKVAHSHFDSSKGFDECERATLSLVNRLQLLDKPATSLEELESYLTELYHEISSIA
jgi:phosphatidylserine/phosphatidylglycerophosphate/cardiolipin synthase-like enzyme